MNAREFDALVEQIIARIPVRYRRLLHNVVFVVEREPPQPDLLGLYEERPPHPSQITIYQGPHERRCANPAQLQELLQETVLHEVGHALGMTEGEVLRMERARRRRLRERARRHTLR